MPAALFYDARGAQLFDEITRLPEYYQTRTEREILAGIVPDLAGELGGNLELIEFGAGSAEKTETLLEGLDVRVYRPVDVSEYYLGAAVKRLKRVFPRVEVRPVLADYSEPVRLGEAGGGTRVGFFPGSTIGNYHPSDAAAFLRRAADLLGPGGAFLLGADLVKDPGRLHVAYNDASGVTAEFNRNVLEHLNASYGGDFEVEHWAHYAFFDPKHSRIEMHLVSDRDQVAYVVGERFEFDAHETLWTESSYKYTEASLRELARKGGMTCERFWVDEEELFSVLLLRVMS